MKALRPVIEKNVPAVFITRDEVTVRNALKIIKEYNLKGIIQASKGILKYADQIAKEKIPVIWAGTTAVPERWEPDRIEWAAVMAPRDLTMWTLSTPVIPALAGKGQKPARGMEIAIGVTGPDPARPAQWDALLRDSWLHRRLPKHQALKWATEYFI